MFSDLKFEPLVPPRWARGGHRQTLLGYLLPSPRIIASYERVQVETYDAEVLVGRYYSSKSKTLVLLFHGLTGCVESGYLQRIGQTCISAGFQVALINHRGAGEGKGYAHQPYHSGRGEDLAAVISHFRKKLPGVSIIAVGFSLSGNALLSLVAGIRGGELPDYAIAVNAPCDLEACSNIISQGLNRIYDYHFVRRLRKNLNEKYEDGFLDQPIPIKRMSSIREIDEKYTAPFGGFKNALDYYEKCSTHKHFDKIACPTFILTSMDDPFVPWEPFLAAKGQNNVYLHIEPQGGHLGYVGKGSRQNKLNRWMDSAIFQTIQSVAFDQR